MEDNPSTKHHYLPRHYLEGFANDKGGFYVYDKKADNLFPTNPGASFYENDLNTINCQNGESSDSLETLYAAIENQSWNSFNKIRSSTPAVPVSITDNMHLFHFLLVLHWRLPSNIPFVEELSNKFFQGNNDLDYLKLRRKTGVEVSRKEMEQITGSTSFKKASKILLPFAPFFKVRNWGNLENWRFLYLDNSQTGFFVGDNPIITKGNNDHDPITCLNEFLFPVSGKILLISKDKPVSKDMGPEFTIEFNNSILERAQRFVASPNRPFLEDLVGYHKMHKDHGKTRSVIQELFNSLE